MDKMEIKEAADSSSFEFKDIHQQNMKLRPYQIEMKNKIFSTWQKGLKSIMMQMPTGTGKTMVFLSIIKDIWDYLFDNRKPLKRFLILVHRKELIEQVKEALYSKYNLAHGTIGGGHKEDDLYHIQVAMVHTLAREKRLQHWKDNEFDFIICDEAHHFLASDYVKIREAFPNAYLLGVTATPYRLNKQPFTDFFDILLRSKSINDFIKEGWLSEYEYYSIAPTSDIQKNINNLKVENTGDYSEREMSIALDNIRVRAGVVKTWLKYAKGKKTIVYTINKNHNNHLCKEFKKKGFNSVAIDSDTPKEDREAYVEKFKKGEITIICNVNIFSEGFDCPDVECIQLARPTKSLSMYLQQVGRGLRIAKNKEKTIFIDNVGLYNRFGLPSANRQWQKHFEGKPDWDEKEKDYPEDVKRIRIIEDEEEADDPTYKIYSNVENKENMTIGNVSESLSIEVEEVLNFFKENIEDVNPNTILTEEQYNNLLKHLDIMNIQTNNKGFINIFDIPNEEAIGKKNFYCMVKDYDENKWETVFYEHFVDCYVDIVGRVLGYAVDIWGNNGFILFPYLNYLHIEMGVGDGDGFVQDKMLSVDELRSWWTEKNIKNDIQYMNKLPNIGDRFFEKMFNDDGKQDTEYPDEINRRKIRCARKLSDGGEIEVCLSNPDKMKKLKFLLTETGETIFFNFDKDYSPNTIENNNIEQAEIIEESEKEINNSEENINSIKFNSDMYDIDKMSEKEIIELMLKLHDHVSISFLDEKKAEERLKAIEKENELQQLDKQIEESGYDDDEIIKMANRIKERRKTKEHQENKELEEIAKRNIEKEDSKRKSALDKLKSKFNEHNA